MKTLIADDDPVSRQMLAFMLQRFGQEVIEAADGTAAWQALQAPDPPSLVILDWLMPGPDGITILRQVRASPQLKALYVVMLTTMAQPEDVVAGLDAGADDYMVKPFKPLELRARLGVGVRVVELRRRLEARVLALEQALAEVKQLRGILPICSYCKKVRSDQDYWQQVESYVAQHTEAKFSHGICPECWQQHVKPMLDALGQEGMASGQGDARASGL